jgi:hypothetical protein
MRACPCCTQLTLPCDGQFEICDVCGWQDDQVQLDDPEHEGGANVLSLNQARARFAGVVVPKPPPRLWYGFYGRLLELR